MGAGPTLGLPPGRALQAQSKLAASSCLLPRTRFPAEKPTVAGGQDHDARHAATCGIMYCCRCTCPCSKPRRSIKSLQPANCSSSKLVPFSCRPFGPYHFGAHAYRPLSIEAACYTRGLLLVSEAVQNGTASRVLAVAKDLSVSSMSASRDQAPPYKETVAEMNGGRPLLPGELCCSWCRSHAITCSCHVVQLGG